MVESAIQRTLVVLKPDAVMRGLMGRVLQRFEDAGLKVVATKMVRMDADFARKHYFDLEERHGNAVYTATVEAMQRGPVLAMVVEGVEAVANVRRLVGGTFPDQAVPGSIRGDFAHTTKDHAVANDKVVANLVHASGNPDEAKYEVELWFGPDEQFSYTTVAETFTF